MGEKFTAKESKPSDFDFDFEFTINSVFLKKFSRENKAILFRLSNKMIQVIFLDKSELIMSSDDGKVIFITSKGELRNTTISNDFKSYNELETTDPSLFKRLNYSKEILLSMINPKSKKLRSKQKKQPMFSTKAYKSDTKENHKFLRKDSQGINNVIDFYATNNIDQQADQNGIVFFIDIIS